MTTVFVCEDSLDGILTGVYEAWNSHLGHTNLRLEIEQEKTLELFCEYRQVPVDQGKAEKVLRTIKRRLGEDAVYWICGAAANADARKADAIYRMIVLGLSLERGSEIVNCLTYEPVALVMKLSQRVSREVDKLMGFVRFKELQNKILYGEIRPVSHVLPYLAPFFADRLCKENWMLHDVGRKLAALHQQDRGWVLVETKGLDKEQLSHLSEKEEAFEQLWKCFHESIAIDSRKNPKLQMNMLPLRYRPYMTEFE